MMTDWKSFGDVYIYKKKSVNKMTDFLHFERIICSICQNKKVNFVYLAKKIGGSSKRVKKRF